jgi:hypothetical protein
MRMFRGFVLFSLLRGAGQAALPASNEGQGRHGGDDSGKENAYLFHSGGWGQTISVNREKKGHAQHTGHRRQREDQDSPKSVIQGSEHHD